MSTLPSERLLASYWIPYVGIGSPTVDVTVPLLDIANYVLKDGTPQTNVVFLCCGTFTGTPESFTAPYITIPDNILSELVAQPGQSRSNVQQLQELGIKVLLTIQGYTPQGQPSGMGWDGVPADQNEAFASWVQTNIIEKYGLDGIDIDNEWSGLAENTQNFMDTVGTLRQYLQGGLLTKALWSDFDYFTTPVSGNAPYNAGAYLSSLLDFGSTMGYGYDAAGLEASVIQYNGITTQDGANVGMAWNKLCIGVQAGPPEASWMTALSDVATVSKWVVEPQSPTKRTPPILGMMLFTFPQDIQQWTHWPQNSPGYMWPNPNDHQWQQTIIEGMWGSDNWVVKEGATAATAEEPAA